MRREPTAHRAAGYLAAILGIALVTILIGAVLRVGSIANLSMLYLLVVLAVAVRSGSGPAIFASVIAFLTFNWFFIEPVHTFTIGDPAEWLALLLFLVVSVVTGQLAAALRHRADEARRREREARALHQLGRLLAEHDDLDAGLQAVARHLQAALGLAGCAILLPADPARGGRVVARAVAGAPPPEAEQSAAQWVLPPQPLPGADSAADAPASGPPAENGGHRRRRPVRIRLPLAQARGDGPSHASFVPLVAHDRTVGILRLVADPKRAGWTPEETRLIQAAAGLVGLAIERARLRQAATEMEVLRKTEEVRQAVLAALAHDLRSPLASIRASAESLDQPDIQWSDDERHAFLAAIRQDAERLHRLVENLLDLSRIEAGKLQPDRGWYPLDALVDDVLARLEPATARHHVRVDVPETLPPVPLDYVQIGQVLANLVENAAKYAPPGTEIAVAARRQGNTVVVSVEDQGPGIPAEALPHVFEKFYRVAGGDRAPTTGTGLGLAVARAFVEAHGGTITVQSPPPGKPQGARFSFTLPLSAAGAPALIAAHGAPPGSQQQAAG